MKTINLCRSVCFYLTIDEERASLIEQKIRPHLPLLQRVDGIKHKDGGMSGCAAGHLKIIRQALLSQKENGPFQPFLVLEDDAWPNLFDTEEQNKTMWTIDVPEDADAVYVGISSSANNLSTLMWDQFGHKLRVIPSPQCPSVWRILTMLSTHAILYVSKRYAIDHMLALVQYLRTRELDQDKKIYPVGHDTFISQMQLSYNVYAMKRPLFYQSAAVGGWEPWTRIYLSDDSVVIVDEEALKNDESLQQQPQYAFIVDLIK